jgi:hypothetical protein
VSPRSRLRFGFVLPHALRRVRTRSCTVNESKQLPRTCSVGIFPLSPESRYPTRIASKSKKGKNLEAQDKPCNARNRKQSGFAKLPQLLCVTTAAVARRLSAKRVRVEGMLLPLTSSGRAIQYDNQITVMAPATCQHRIQGSVYGTRDVGHYTSQH